MIKTFEEFIKEAYYSPETKDLTLDIYNKTVEFKPSDGEDLFTYMEADALMKDGLEMLDGEEWDYIRENYECVWDNERKGLLIDGRIFLPAIDGEYGEYWVPERIGPDDTYETLYFDNKDNVEQGYKDANEKCLVCLVRYIK